VLYFPLVVINGGRVSDMKLKTVALPLAFILSLAIGGSAGASTSPLAKWVSHNGSHLKAVVVDERSLVSITDSTPNAQIQTKCRDTESDVTYLEGRSPVPVASLRKRLHSILAQLAKAGIECQAAVAGNDGSLAKKAGVIIGDEDSQVALLLAGFKKDGASLAKSSAVHYVVPTTTTTTSPVYHVGATLSTSSVSIQLQQVIDPATPGDQYLTPNTGNRFVGVKVEISNPGTANIQDDANSDFTVIGNNGQIYTADFDSIAGCTNFNDGEYGLTPNASAIGCVTFQLPTGVTVTKVEFQGSNSNAEWDVP
jgi:hypothetical protein